jgi:hypothetical protein
MITVRIVYFLSFVAIFFVSTSILGAHFYLRHRQRQKYPYGKWETLLKRLGSIDHANLAFIVHDPAGEQATPDAAEYALDPERAWRLLGGMEGLETIEKNCAVLIDLVYYVQQWYPEALLVAEQLRLNAREVQWHIDRLKGAAKTGRLKTAVPDYLQQALAIYYHMTREVLALYAQTGVPGLTDLQRAL